MKGIDREATSLDPGLNVPLTSTRLIEYINSHEGVQWVTIEQMCDEFKKHQASSSSAKATQT